MDMKGSGYVCYGGGWRSKKEELIYVQYTYMKFKNKRGKVI